MTQRVPQAIANEGDLVFDVEAGDHGPFPAVSRRSQNAYQLTANGDIVFRTGGVERGRIKANGAVTGIFAVGQEIGYDQITAPVAIVGLTQGTATTVIAGSAYTFDGSPVICEVSSPAIILPSVAGASFNVALYEGATIIGVLGTFVNPAAAGSDIPACLKYRFTPSAASHTYSVKCYVSSTTGTPQFFAQTAGVADVPAYLRFTKV